MGNYWIDITGKRFGRLIALKCVGSNKNKVKVWLCRCDCGNEKEIIGQSLILGNTKSCGCIQKEYFNSLVPERRSRKYAPIVCGIYKVTNPQEEVYIGHSRTIYKRWLRHREGKKNLTFHRSINEFGWKNHKWEIIHELPYDVTDNTLICYEQLYMDAYREIGTKMLNIKDAGSNSKFPESSKKLMSETRRVTYIFNYNGEKIEIVGLKKYCTDNGLGERQMSQVYNNNGFYAAKNYYKGYSRIN